MKYVKYKYAAIGIAAIIFGWIMLLWGSVLISCSPAHAKDWITPRERVAGAFLLLPRAAPPVVRPIPPKTPPKAGRTMRTIVPYYIFDHWTAYTDGHGNAGKFWIVRECSVDVKQDPGETSCKMTWAKI